MPTIICVIFCILCFCCSRSRPPQTGRILIPVSPTSFLASIEICIANSLVGAIIKACTYFFSGLIFSIKGTRNAKVLPVPVWALAITSFPAKIAGITCSCTGIGLVIPTFFRRSTVLAHTLRPAKPFVITIPLFYRNVVYAKERPKPGALLKKI